MNFTVIFNNLSNKYPYFIKNKNSITVIKYYL